MGIGSLMHHLAWRNPLYHVFYSTATMATTVAVILGIALGVALARRHNAASIGLGVGLVAAVTASAVLSTSITQIDNTFAYIDQSHKYDTPVTGVQFIGWPIAMGVVAATLLVLAGVTLRNSRRSMPTKLLLTGTFLLGAAVFGTFGTSMANDIFEVGSIYAQNWSTVDTYFWLTDLVLAGVVALLALVVGVQYLRNNFELVSTDDPYWQRLQFTGDKHLNRTAEAPATA